MVNNQYDFDEFCNHLKRIQSENLKETLRNFGINGENIFLTYDSLLIFEGE